ncbi:MAG: DUF4132 domain-containing protein [Bradymonadia bacterium]
MTHALPEALAQLEAARDTATEAQKIAARTLLHRGVLKDAEMPDQLGFWGALLVEVEALGSAEIGYSVPGRVEGAAAALKGHSLTPWICVAFVRAACAGHRKNVSRMLSQWMRAEPEGLLIPLRYWLAQPRDPSQAALTGMLSRHCGSEDVPLLVALGTGGKQNTQKTREFAHNALVAMGPAVYDAVLDGAQAGRGAQVGRGANALFSMLSRITPDTADQVLHVVQRMRAEHRIHIVSLSLCQFVLSHNQVLGFAESLDILKQESGNNSMVGHYMGQLLHQNAGDAARSAALALLSDPAFICTEAAVTYFRIHPHGEAAEGLKKLLQRPEAQKSHHQESIGRVFNACNRLTQAAIHKVAPAADIAELDALLAQAAPAQAVEHRYVKLPDTLPALRWENGSELSPAAQSWVMFQLASESTALNADLYAVRRRWQPESASAWLAAACDHFSGGEPWPEWAAVTWSDNSIHYERRYGVDTLVLYHGHMGNDAQIQALHDACYSLSTHPMRMFDAFAASALPSAIGALETWARKGLKEGRPRDKRTTKYTASRALEAMAKRMGLSVGALSLMSVPYLGFDDAGQHTLSYDGRDVILEVQSDGKLAVLDKGKKRSSLPKASVNADIAETERAKGRFKAIKSTLSKALKAQGERLEEALMHGTRLTPAVWSDIFQRHPIGRVLGQALVFSAHPESGDAPFFFGLDVSGDACDVEGATVQIHDASVALTHPADMEAEALSAWRERLKGMTPPIKQLDRMVHTPPASGAPFGMFYASGGARPVDPGRLIRSFGKLNMVMYGQNSRAWVDTAEWRLGDRTVVISHSGWPIRTRDAVDPVEILEISVTGGELSVSTYSEICKVFSELLGVIL